MYNLMSVRHRNYVYCISFMYRTKFKKVSFYDSFMFYDIFLLCFLASLDRDAKPDNTISCVHFMFDKISPSPEAKISCLVANFCQELFEANLNQTLLTTLFLTIICSPF